MLQRCLDSKAAVRKAALVLMKKSASLLGRPPDGDIVEAMGAACGDTMVSIRKSALAALSEVWPISSNIPMFMMEILEGVCLVHSAVEKIKDLVPAFSLIT